MVNTRKTDPEGPKDANDALKMGKDLSEYLKEAKPISGDNIIKLGDIKSDVIHFLSQYDQFSGYKSSSFNFFNQKLKGLRMGEFTVLTGETGSGKTTFLTQLSLDFLQQRVPTLWGSFEIKNDKLASLFLMQYAKKDLRQSSIQELEYQTENFEQLPLYMLKFHGSQNIDEIINTMTYAVYNYDIQNIILDNLQFMIGMPTRLLNKFDFQDEIIHRLRKFSTEKNVHVTLVIHPKKTDESLKITSIFGTAKASQEADNVFILQSFKGIRIVEIAKNRFDGSTGKVPIAFDPTTCRFFEMTEDELVNYTKSNGKVEDIIKERVAKYGSIEQSIHNNETEMNEESRVVDTLISQKEKEAKETFSKLVTKSKILVKNDKTPNKKVPSEIDAQAIMDNFEEIEKEQILEEIVVDIKELPKTVEETSDLDFKTEERTTNPEISSKNDNVTSQKEKKKIDKGNLKSKSDKEDITQKLKMVMNIESETEIKQNKNKASSSSTEEEEQEQIKSVMVEKETLVAIEDFQKSIFPKLNYIDTFHTQLSKSTTPSFGTSRFDRKKKFSPANKNQERLDKIMEDIF